MDASLIARTNVLPRFNTGSLQAWLFALLLLAAALFASSAQAALDVRVESRPIANPIEAYITVTDANGNPVGGLTGSDFTVTLDGAALLTAPSFSQPPSVNPAKHVSVVFAMDYSPSTQGDPRAAMESAVVSFINAMSAGDYAAIVKFNQSNPAHASVVQPFTNIGTGKDALVNAAMLPYPGSSSNVYDGINVALDHFAAPPAGVTLPDGPKAVVLISDGLDNSSTTTLDAVINKASILGIPVFTIGVANPGTTGSRVMESLAARTGGNYIEASTQTAVTDAYATISTRLDNGYLLSFASSIADCGKHTLVIAVTGQGSQTVDFTRCDTTTGPVTVPNVVNMTQSAASTALNGASLAVGTVVQQSSATVAAGSVISQSPASGTGVPAGSAVNLVVSTGPAPAPGPVMVTVPTVVNLTRAQAIAAIGAAGLIPGTESPQASIAVPLDSVISQSPGSGTSVAAGSAVSLVVSTGPVMVPNVVNLAQAAATTAITGAGLTVGTITQQSHATVAAGNVVSQSPTSGTGVAPGSVVSVVVSTGPTAPPPPPPSGGGGGGALGVLELLAGLGMLAAARRRRTAPGA